MTLDGKLLTVKEVLEMADVSRHTLYRDTQNGKIEAIHFGKSVRYKEADAIEYANSKKDSSWCKHYRKDKDG